MVRYATGPGAVPLPANIDVETLFIGSAGLITSATPRHTYRESFLEVNN